MTQHTDAYTMYLASEAWQLRRIQAIAAADSKCERCAKPGTDKSLHVHHLTYERLGRERVSDLRALCRDCHTIEDEERRASKDALPKIVSPSTLQTRSFLAYVDALHNANGTPITDEASRERIKRWVIESVRQGYAPAAIADDHIYRPEDHDVEP